MQWASNDLDVMLGTRQSFSQWERERKAMFFESKEEAVQRVEKRKRDELEGLVKKKRHSPDPSKVHFDKSGLLNEVKNLKEGDQINFSELARKHGIDGQNGNQVAKEYLESQGMALNKFKNNRCRESKVRRRLNRMQGGEITTPVPRTSKRLRETLKKKIENGEYEVGELIVPRKYMKLSLTKEGTIKEEEFIVSGRKILLLAIRKKLLEKQVNLGVVWSILNTDYTSFDVGTLKRKLKHLNPHTDTDELSKPQLIAQIKGFEQNRHLLVWSDHASVMNHGHLMLTVKTLYDEGFYLTREEYKEIYGKDLDIETLIEEPQLYIFSRCRDSLQEKVAYTDTRREDILEMNVKIRINGHENMVTDTIKYFNGDHPEQASESGNLEGGDVPCAGCGARAQSFIDLEYCFRAEHLTLEDRRLKVLQGPAGRSRRNGGIKPFFNLKKDEIFDELDWRQIKYNTRMQKKELEMLLKDELGGVARVPLLCQGNEFESLSNTPLKQYEVLSSEALHDIKEHIRNLWEELPQHLTDEENACFSKVIEATTKQKDKIRGVDFRLSAIIMCNTIRGKCRPSVQQLLDSLVEISRLLYAPAEERTPKFVLRLYNMTFQHAHLCISIINKPKSLTQRKFYGQYFHSISTETALNSRVVSPKSTNTEDEERHFSRVSSICSATSSRAPDHIIINSIIRMQAEMKIGNGERENSSYAKKESEISKFNKVTPRPGNSTFQAQMLSKGYYQAHLERISDYIAVGPGIWWHKDEATGNIVFHDGPDEPETRPEGPPLYHFRNTSIKWLRQHLSEKWQQCVSNGIGFIPLTRLTVYNEDGNLKAIYTERQPTEKEESDEGLQLELIRDVSDTPPETCQLLSESSDRADTIPVSLTAIPDEEIACDLEEDLSTSSSKLAAKDVTDTVTNEPPAPSPNNLSDTGEISHLENMTKDVPSKPSTPEDQRMKESNKSNSPYQTPLTIRTLVNKRVQGLTLQSQVLPKKLCEKMEQNIALKTSLATTVSKIIGSTEDVVLLDKCRENVRKNPNSKANISSYELSLAKVQTKVLEEYSHIKGQLKSWDTEFVKNKSVDPVSEDYQKDPVISSVYKKLKLCKKLLDHWKITAYRDNVI